MRPCPLLYSIAFGRVQGELSPGRGDPAHGFESKPMPPMPLREFPFPIPPISPAWFFFASLIASAHPS